MPCGNDQVQPTPAPTSRETDPVVTPARQPPVISGGTLAVLSDGSVAAADPDRDAVWLVSADRATVRRVALQPGDEPGRVIEGPTGIAFVSLRRGGAVAQLDLATGLVAARHPVCGAPRGLAWISSQSTLAVACATGTLARLRFHPTAIGLPLDSISTSLPANDLRDVVAVGEALYLSTYRDAQLLLIDFDGAQKWIPMGTLGSSDVRGVAWRLTRTPNGLAMTHQTARPDGLMFSAACRGDLDKQPLVVEGNNEYAVPGGLVSGGYTVIDSSGNATERFINTGDSVAPLPVDMAFTAGGAWALTSLDRVVYSDGSGVVQASMFNAGEVTSVAWSGDAVVAFSREPAKLTWWTPVGESRGLVREVSLPGAESVKSTGHTLFYRRTSSGLSCASCHPEAGEDGRTWLLPEEGPRRTPTLRGGLRGTAPFHWTGNLSTMGALLDEVMFGRMGGIAQSDARTEALVDWLDAQPALPPPDGLDRDAVARGKALFESPAVGCASCHAGLQGTNNSNSDVGTGQVLQVPRLRELASRPPYFHDGRIPQLEDRFLPEAGGDRHGVTSQLSDQERVDLVAYLKSL